MKKPKIGMLEAMWLCYRYSKKNEAEKDELRTSRLKRMVEWAKENSPYYAALYQNIGSDFTLSELPTVNKGELMRHWDEWITDRCVTRRETSDFMTDLDNVGRKLKRKYLVFTTSGSTGNPLVALCDNTTSNVMGAINVIRSFTRSEDIRAYIKHGGKSIGIFATGGFYLGNSSIRARLLKIPWKKRQMAVTSALLPVEKIVAELNAFQPAMLGGYPSNLELLIDEQKSGRLHINPVLIMTGGEYLSEHLRERLAEAFGCYVQTSYGCTEGGTIGCECTEHHFHINDDWVIIEAVDNNGNPVPDGVQADKILLTNLFNFTQPFIRYEVTDRAVMHHEPCKCGKTSPWLTLEGRTDDIVGFLQDGKEIKLAPLAIYATLKEVHELRRFQLVAHTDNHAVLRLEPAEGISKQAAFEKAKLAFGEFLKTHGVTDVRIELSEESPKQDAGSGKFKHIISAV